MDYSSYNTTPPVPNPAARIAIDAMGSDMGPSEFVAAAKLALAEFPSLHPMTLVGDEPTLRALAAKAGIAAHPKIAFFHASQIVTMDDNPLAVIRTKKDSSMLRAIEQVKNGFASAIVSCGNTGCLVGAGIIKLRTLEGMDRAALAAIVPRQGGHFTLLDAGANPDAKPAHLVHNAIMGAHFARVEFGIERPRVGLLTIGTEEGKGNTLITETHDALKRLAAAGIINYTGPVEGFHLFATDHVDVVICDGFVGNICLKSWESLAKFFTKELKSNLLSNPLRKLGALLSKGAFDALRRRVQPERFGGAPLLGINGVLVKAHGSANRHALKNAIHDASEMITVNINHLIEADVEKANALIASGADAALMKNEQ